eukprot:m.40066 g.40066  ORF g.40066 m.40066 type:complete len:51 (-) comp5974_c0_seq3:741-893(-)
MSFSRILTLVVVCKHACCARTTPAHESLFSLIKRAGFCMSIAQCDFEGAG